jgi:threonyl-tRNA synthetase
MAAAVKELFPGTKFGIGPAIDNGFYYDFDIKDITTEDLAKIEKKMRELISQGLLFVKENVSKNEAKEIFKDQPYKLELIEELPDGEITIYRTGDFVDLCAGPHVESSKRIPPDALKLEKIAGAYWRGSEKNAMLQRIYGLAFASKKEMEDYLKLQEELKKRDHRVIGKDWTFCIYDLVVGSLLPKRVHNPQDSGTTGVDKN